MDILRKVSGSFGTFLGFDAIKILGNYYIKNELNFYTLQKMANNKL